MIYQITHLLGLLYFIYSVKGYTTNEINEWKYFTLFQEKFNKKYQDIKELEERFNIFQQNIRTIYAHNSIQSQNFTMGMNQFTDLTPQEFKEKYISGLKSKLGNSVENYGCKMFKSTKTSVLSEIDWVKTGVVTSVKDQGQCGSCWAFSSTGAIESAWAIKTGKLLDLSEQQLVDCATGLYYGSNGCNGGEMEGAFKYVTKNGQCLLDTYPYTARGTSCEKCIPVVHISSCSDVAPNDQLSLKEAVSNQPVSIAIEADTRYFQSYSGGILTSTTCGTNLDHGVLITGYGEENGQKYWNVKNSWGTTWGENGYIKIARSESESDPGICGIAKSPTFPSV